MVQIILPPLLRQTAGLALLEALKAGEGRVQLVGGVVRDALCGHPGQDIDLATQLTPKTAMARARAAGFRVIPTGLAHGTISILCEDQRIEVTTLRRDVATNGRHATVAFTDDWREDAARRDFTINALFAHPITGVVSDYFGGIEDLAARRVRFIGDPAQRIAEDHLRILRFFRFQARFGGAVDEPALAACVAAADSLQALSRERVREELLKLLASVDPVPVLSLMLTHGLLAPILPEIQAAALDDLARLVAVEQALGLPDSMRRLAVLVGLGDVDTLADLGGRLRLSNAQRARLIAMTGEPLVADWAVVARAAYLTRPQTVIDRLIVHAKEAGAIAPVIAALIPWTPPSLPVSGKHLIALGIVPGRAVSQALAAFEEAWVAADFPSAYEPLLEAAARRFIL